jgi:hypothetical protein
MSTFVIVPGAWDTPAVMEPLLEPLESAGHTVTVVDLPCGKADASLEEYANAVRSVDLSPFFPPVRSRVRGCLGLHPNAGAPEAGVSGLNRG